MNKKIIIQKKKKQYICQEIQQRDFKEINENNYYCIYDKVNYICKFFILFFIVLFPFFLSLKEGYFLFAIIICQRKSKIKKETAYAVSGCLLGCSCCTELCFGASRKADCRSAAINNGISGASI